MIESSTDEAAHQEPLEISLGYLLRNKYTAFAYFTEFVAYFTMAYTVPVLSTHIYTIGFTPEYFGVFLGLNALFFASNLYTIKRLLKVCSRREVIYLGGMIQICGLVVF